MRVNRVTSATSVLLVTSTVDNNRVLESSCTNQLQIRLSYQAQKKGKRHTLAGSIQRLQVKDVNALHFTDEFETLETGGLFDIGRDGTGLSTGGDEVFFGLDLYSFRWLASDRKHPR